MNMKEIITPREIDFDGFPVKRCLPRRNIRGVGPWVFFDHMGPHHLNPGKSLDVLPHPHINLATVTYLFKGEIQHRDTLGNSQMITPGAVNLMVAGRGIAHSERTPDRLRNAGHDIHGLQLWHALPADVEEVDPSFHHYSEDSIPETEKDDLTIRVLAGEAYGLSSPVKTFCHTLYVEYKMSPGSSLILPDAIERAIYLVSGGVSVGVETVNAGQFALLDGTADRITSDEGCRLVLIGGEPLGPRYMWWNFVSSSRERIEQAKTDWKEGRFGLVFEDEDEFFPLPENDGHAKMKDI
jgi:redox-sensitive bicupin YhaK (pirin superfamily)